jgi:mRNA interferase MazF
VASPARGEIWVANLDPTAGREQAGTRPALIVSVDPFNSGPRDLVIVTPVTGTLRGLPTHIPLTPPEGGMSEPSVVMTEEVRAISRGRLGRRLGGVSPATLGQVEDRLRLLLDL